MATAWRTDSANEIPLGDLCLLDSRQVEGRADGSPGPDRERWDAPPGPRGTRNPRREGVDHPIRCADVLSHRAEARRPGRILSEGDERNATCRRARTPMKRGASQTELFETALVRLATVDGARRRFHTSPRGLCALVSQDVAGRINTASGSRRRT